MAMNSLKNMILTILVSICMIPAVFASLSRGRLMELPTVPPTDLPEDAKVFTKGLDTEVVPGESLRPAIFDHYYGYKSSDVVIVDSSGYEIRKPVQTLNISLKNPNFKGSLDTATALWVLNQLHDNKAVICPDVIDPKDHSYVDTVKRYFVGKDKVPVIAVGTTDTSVCNKIAELFGELSKK